MSRYLSMANRKLLFARLLLSEFPNGGGNVHRQQALVESVVFQLRLAYHFHLQDIAASYQCRQPALVADVAGLSQQLTDINKWPSEAREMQSLLDDQGSWLALLLRGYGDCFEAGEGQTVQNPQASADFIAVALLPEMGEFPELTHDLLMGLLEALTEMVERHREGMFEC